MFVVTEISIILKSKLPATLLPLMREKYKKRISVNFISLHNSGDFQLLLTVWSYYKKWLS